MSDRKELRAAIKAVVKEGDFSKLTVKRIRELVAERTGIDTETKENRLFIRDVVDEVIEQAGDDEDEVSEDEVLKKKKKQKRPAEKEEKEEEDGDEGGEEADGKKVEKGLKAKKAKKWQRGDSGEIIVCELSGKRKLTVGEYRGKLFISIREYYEKNGQQLPGQKGISLTPEQWQTVKDHVNDVDSAINEFS